jgi:Amt family ammonium transporter
VAALDVWGVHGVGGFLGIILCGIFATTAFNPEGVDGLLRGNPHFFLFQLGAVAISSHWAFAFTLGMLWLIDKVTPVKVDAEMRPRARQRAPWRDRLSRGDLASVGRAEVG